MEGEYVRHNSIPGGWGLTGLGIAFLIAFTAGAGNWPHFQGPNRNGVSLETGLARSWPASGPKELWSFPLEKGFAGPVVHNGEVFVLDRVDDKQDVLRCLSFETGKELWAYTYDAPGKVGHSGSRTTAAVSDTHVFTVGQMGHFTCVDRNTHKPVWQINLQDIYLDGKSPRWGLAQSPTLYKDMVIVAPQSEDAFVAAFKQDSGELVWKTEGLGMLGYSTPLLTTLCDVEQVVMIGACVKPGMGSTLGWVAGFSPDNGKTLWKYNGWQCFIPIPYPTVLPGNRLFLTGGYEAGSGMIQISRDGDAFEAKELFRTDTCGSQIQLPLVYGDHIYVNSNSNERTDGMMCMTFDGSIVWNTTATEGLPDFERGNLILADNMIVTLDGKDGILYLVEPSPEGYKELASAALFKGREMWSPMALADGRLVIRGQDEMKCLDLRAQ